MNRRTALLLLALPVVLAGCAAPDKAAQPKKVAQEGAVAPAVETTVTTTPAKPADFHVGDTVELAGGNRLTVHTIGDYVPEADGWQKPDAGNRFVAADVEGCSVKDAASMNPFSFELQMPDHTRLQASLNGNMEPALHATDVMPGDCVRGFVTYEVPVGQMPAAVFYDGSTQIKWVVG